MTKRYRIRRVKRQETLDNPLELSQVTGAGSPAGQAETAAQPDEILGSMRPDVLRKEKLESVVTSRQPDVVDKDAELKQRPKKRQPKESKPLEEEELPKPNKPWPPTIIEHGETVKGLLDEKVQDAYNKLIEEEALRAGTDVAGATEEVSTSVPIGERLKGITERGKNVVEKGKGVVEKGRGAVKSGKEYWKERSRVEALNEVKIISITDNLSIKDAAAKIGVEGLTDDEIATLEKEKTREKASWFGGPGQRFEGRAARGTSRLWKGLTGPLQEDLNKTDIARKGGYAGRSVEEIDADIAKYTAYLEESEKIPGLEAQRGTAKGAYEGAERKITKAIERISRLDTAAALESDPKERKRLEGEVAAAQEELSGYEKTRDDAYTEMQRLSNEINNLNAKKTTAQNGIASARKDKVVFDTAYRAGLEKHKKETGLRGGYNAFMREMKKRGEQMTKEDVMLGKMKSVTDVIASPIGDTGKNWEKIMGRGTPGYREGRSVTDIVGGGGTTRDRMETLGAVTSLRSSGVSKMGLPTVRARGIAMTPALTVNVKGIGVGDVSAMGIHVRKEAASPFSESPVSQPVLENTRIMPLDDSYAGSIKQQKVKVKTSKHLYTGITIPTMDNVKMPSVAGRLELGKASVGIFPSTYKKAMLEESCKCGIKGVNIGIANIKATTAFVTGKKKANKGRRKK